MTVQENEAQGSETQAQQTEQQAQGQTQAQETQGPSLDEILAEFNAGNDTQPANGAGQQKTDPSAAEVISNRIARLEEAAFRNDVNSVVSHMTKDLELPDDARETIEDLLDGEARRDPLVSKAFSNRHANPAAWARAQSALGKKLESRLQVFRRGSVDTKVTEDVKAVRAAAKAQTDTQAVNSDDVERVVNMSDEEFRSELENKYGVYL